MPRTLNIATADSRKSAEWHNQTITWRALQKKLFSTKRTPETVAEYKAMPKEQADEIKDVGGFVGGYVDGSRSRTKNRSIVCLDADYATTELWDDILMQDFACICYSTHKHTPEAPRLRFVLPLERDVSLDEYAAISRRLASMLGMDYFDDTTYQPQRLMYWPSTSVDGEYFFRCNSTGDWIDPDAILATYEDWTDSTSWPVSSREKKAETRRTAKAEDPLEKDNIIGDFCRAHDIHDAIAKWVPCYAPAGEGRYTYTEGSTHGGVVVYDDKWTYSNHDTDPASRQLCNAYDLVRIHHCGGDDSAMVELCNSDPATKQEISKRIQSATADDFEQEEEEDTEWRSKLRTKGKQGNLDDRYGIFNASVILNNHPQLKDKIGYNLMTDRKSILADLPWGAPAPRDWTDTDNACLRAFMESQGLKRNGDLDDALSAVAAKHKFHPIRDYLNGLAWDGTERLDTLFISYLGAEDSEYTRAITRKTLVAAVARVMRPGCKFDYMLTLRGQQGVGKSTILSKLGGKWFSDSFVTVQGKEAFEQLSGVWIMEVGELAGLKRASKEAIKSFISKSSDTYRKAYGHETEDYKRQCIFCATTNESQFLDDETGNRRYWILDMPNQPAKDIWTDLTQSEIDQVWAEAVTRYKAGEELMLSKEMEAEASRIRSIYEDDRPELGTIEAYLSRLLPEDWTDRDVSGRVMWLDSEADGSVERVKVCAKEIWVEALGRNMKEYNSSRDSRSISAMLASLGWQKDRKGLKYGSGPYKGQHYYVRVKKRGSA